MSNTSLENVSIQDNEKHLDTTSTNNAITASDAQEKGYKIIKSKDADATLKFQEEFGPQVSEITPEQEAKLSRKVSWFIVTFTFVVDLLLYMDKATLSYASILGLFEDTHISQDDYNNANTLFYVGFLIGQLPGNYLLQRLPIGKFLFIIISLWTIIIFLHCAAFNKHGLIALRFFLGFTESSVVPLLNLTLGQFLTAKEKAASAPIFYSSCLGVTIPAGFIAYGVLYSTSSIHPWRIFMIITGGLTSILAGVVYFFYPNNPATAKFLTVEERVWVIRRVQSTTGSAIEQKVFKKHQLIEALKDPVSWLFGMFFLLQQLANNLPYQQNLLFTEMGGISNLDSTLVSVASGGFAVICCLISSYVLIKVPNITAFSVVFWSLPSLVGSIVAVSLPWNNSVGLLAALCLASPVFGIPWILMFSWSITSSSGYTKKLTRNVINMFWYCIANIISPQLWREKDAPRYQPAWIVQIVLSFFTAPSLALVIYFILKRRNTQRLANLKEDFKVGVVEESSGKDVVVNIASLDLTDLENEAFIYPL